jgi:hypothetical protein
MGQLLLSTGNGLQLAAAADHDDGIVWRKY